MSDHIHEMFEKAAQDGQRIRGGCDQCDAFQSLDEEAPGLFVLTTHHDEDCPVWLAMQAGEQ